MDGNRYIWHVFEQEYGIAPNENISVHGAANDIKKYFRYTGAVALRNFHTGYCFSQRMKTLYLVCLFLVAAAPIFTYSLVALIDESGCPWLSSHPQNRYSPSHSNSRTANQSTGSEAGEGNWTTNGSTKAGRETSTRASFARMRSINMAYSKAYIVRAEDVMITPAVKACGAE